MSQPAKLTPPLVGLFAFACGVIVANLYYAQPVIALIAPDVHLSDHAASMIVSLTQIGYGIGLLFLVPLADLLENRRLVLVMLAAAFLSLILAACARSGPVFLTVSLLIGIASVAVHMLMPLAAHMAPNETRGRAVGNVMGGLVLGILLSRPLSSLIADHFGWRAVFFTGASFMALMALLLAFTLPRRQPEHSASYFALIRSLGTLWAHHPALRRRTFFQACMFCAFSLFWTAAPLELARQFHLSQTQIALFALVGATGAVAAPLSGRLADAGHTVVTTFAVMAVAAVVMLLGLFPQMRGVIALGATGVVLDFCVQANTVQGQRNIFRLDPVSRGRLNGIYMAGIFGGGAVGSALASTLYAQGGWPLIALAAAIAPALGVAVFLLTLKQSREDS